MGFLLPRHALAGAASILRKRLQARVRPSHLFPREETMRSTTSLLQIGGLSALLLLTHGAMRPAQEYSALIGMSGTDTIAVDRYTRNETTLEGVLLVRSPYTHTLHYTAMLAPDGRFSTLEMVWRNLDGHELRKARIAYGVDSIRSQLSDPTERSFSALPTLDAIPLPPRPYAYNAYAMLEHAVLVITMAKKTTDPALEWILAGATEALARNGHRLSGDTIEVGFLDGPLHAVVDTTGRLVWLSGDVDGRTIIVQRSESDVDLSALATSFASRDTTPRNRLRDQRP
jgi:hypothetical protein